MQDSLQNCVPPVPLVIAAHYKACSPIGYGNNLQLLFDLMAIGGSRCRNGLCNRLHRTCKRHGRNWRQLPCPHGYPFDFLQR